METATEEVSSILDMDTVTSTAFSALATASDTMKLDTPATDTTVATGITVAMVTPDTDTRATVIRATDTTVATDILDTDTRLP